MIKDSIKNSIFYHNLNDNFKIAFEFLLKNDLKSMSLGTHNIKGEDIYVNIDSYQTKLLENTKFEAHQKYIDIQLMIEGSERIALEEKKSLIIDVVYDKTRDVEFFNEPQKNNFIELKEKDFVVFYPHEAHRPCVCINEPQLVKKAVVKIKIN